jgi:hypothetical protein
MPLWRKCRLGERLQVDEPQGARALGWPRAQPFRAPRPSEPRATRTGTVRPGFGDFGHARHVRRRPSGPESQQPRTVRAFGGGREPWASVGTTSAVDQRPCSVPRVAHPWGSGLLLQAGSGSRRQMLRYMIPANATTASTTTQYAIKSRNRKGICSAASRRHRIATTSTSEKKWPNMMNRPPISPHIRALPGAKPIKGAPTTTQRQILPGPIQRPAYALRWA